MTIPKIEEVIGEISSSNPSKIKSILVGLYHFYNEPVTPQTLELFLTNGKDVFSELEKVTVELTFAELTHINLSNEPNMNAETINRFFGWML